MNSNLFVGIIAVIALVLGGVAYSRPATEVTPPSGAVPGTEHSNLEAFQGGIVIGGTVFATTSQGSVTYVAGTIANASLIQHTASAAVTATLPASSTLSGFAPRAGDTKTIYLAPITSMVTLAGGTGTELNTASATSSKACVAGGLCRLDFVRKSNRDFEVLLSQGY